MEKKTIDFYFGRRKSSAKINDLTFELGEVSEIELFAKDWKLNISYEDGKAYHSAPPGLEAFVDNIGKDIGRVMNKAGDKIGPLVLLNEGYNINIKYTD